MEVMKILFIIAMMLFLSIQNDEWDVIDDWGVSTDDSSIDTTKLVNNSIIKIIGTDTIMLGKKSNETRKVYKDVKGNLIPEHKYRYFVRLPDDNIGGHVRYPSSFDHFAVQTFYRSVDKNKSIQFCISDSTYKENLRKFDSVSLITEGKLFVYFLILDAKEKTYDKVINSIISSTDKIQSISITSFAPKSINLRPSKRCKLNYLNTNVENIEISIQNLELNNELLIRDGIKKLSIIKTNVDSISISGTMENYNSLFSTISKLKLKSLTLQLNNFTALPNLEMFDKLSNLWISGQEINTLDLNNLPNKMKKIIITRTNTSQIIPLNKVKEIDSLYITFNELENVDGAFVNLKGLKYLSLVDNKIKKKIDISKLNFVPDSINYVGNPVVRKKKK